MNRLDLIIDNIMYAKILKESAHQDELLEEALAAAHELKVEKQAALDKKADNARELGLNYEPEQEPVKCTCGYAIGHPLVTSCSCKPRIRR